MSARRLIFGPAEDRGWDGLEQSSRPPPFRRSPGERLVRELNRIVQFSSSLPQHGDWVDRQLDEKQLVKCFSTPYQTLTDGKNFLVLHVKKSRMVPRSK